MVELGDAGVRVMFVNGHRQLGLVVFVLTGECRSGRNSPDYQVYHQLANATSGQVFNVIKNDVKDILKYIEESITGIESKLVDKTFSPGYDKNVTVSILMSQRMAVKVTDTKPGRYYVTIGSTSVTHVVVSAKSAINFQLGFNVFKPKSSKDIVTRPPPKGNVFMGVKLLGSGVKLETVKILGMSDEVIKELKLELLDEKAQFYVTPLFDPPSTMFRVTINGYDIDSKTPITRVSPTPISRQDLSTDFVAKVDTAPNVTIDGDKSVTLYVDDPLELTCKVHAYPEPEIIWEDKNLGVVIPSETNIVEVPYDYVNILKVDRVEKNTTYQCKAKNSIGDEVQGVEIIAKRRFYFNVIDSPKEKPVIDKSVDEIRITEKNNGELSCRILKGIPKPTITWSFRGLGKKRKLKETGETIQLKNAKRHKSGVYTCRAENVLGTDNHETEVIVEFDVSPIILHLINICFEQGAFPKALKRAVITSVYKVGDSADPSKIMKRIINQSLLGYLTKNGTLSSSQFGLQQGKSTKDAIQVLTSSVTEKLDTGSKCLAVFLELKKAFDTVSVPTLLSRLEGIGVRGTPLTLFGEYLSERSYVVKIGTVVSSEEIATYGVGQGNPPQIKRNVKKKKIVDGDEVELTCDVIGVPAPTVFWTFNSTKLRSTERKQITTDYSLIIKTTLADTGYYACHAENKLGTDEIKVFLQVYVPVTIEKPISNLVQTLVGRNESLYCKANGYPAPDIKWTFHSAPGAPGKDVL
ncbi:unnamed protein product [Spodoptera exigua]|nr:unnamed protein product [Spodoptera exigua]